MKYKEHITNIVIGVIVAVISGAVLFYFFNKSQEEKKQYTLVTPDVIQQANIK